MTSITTNHVELVTFCVIFFCHASGNDDWATKRREAICSESTFAVRKFAWTPSKFFLWQSKFSLTFSQKLVETIFFSRIWLVSIDLMRNYFRKTWCWTPLIWDNFCKTFFLCFSITIFEYNPCLCVILPGSNFLAKVSYRNPTKRFQICLKLTLALLTSFGCFFNVNFEHISHLFLVLILMLYSVLMNYIVEWSTDESASSNNSSATLDELFECVTTLWRWCLKV